MNLRTAIYSCPILLIILNACSGVGVKLPEDSGAVETASEAPLEGLDELGATGALDVIIVHSDTLRLDHLSAYGYPRATQPVAEAAPHLIVEGFHAPAPWTLPSTASALLSLSPEHHGRVSIASPQSDPETDTLAGVLQEAGYATGLFSGNQILAGDEVLADGFDERVQVESVLDVEAQTLTALAVQAQDWIETLPEDQPYLVWIQPMDVHAPFRPTAKFRGTWADYDTLPFETSDDPQVQEQKFEEAYREAETDAEREALVANLRAVYDELVLQQDDALGDLFAWLQARGRLDRTLVVLSSDHGETLGDDQQGTFSHMRTVRPELVKIPLIFFNPNLSDTNIDCLSTNTDLGPTVLRALAMGGAEIGALDGTDGQALQDGCREHVVSSLYMNETSENNMMGATITDGRYRLDWSCPDGTPAVFDLDADPYALHPLNPRDVAEVPALQEAMLAWYADANTFLGDPGCMVPEL